MLDYWSIIEIPPAFDALVLGSPSENYHNVWYGKTGNGMMWLPDGEDMFITSDKAAGKCVCPRSFVCLSLC